MKYEDSPISKMVEKALNEAFETDKNFQITKKELKNLVKQTLLEEAINHKKKKIQQLNEEISRLDEENQEIQWLLNYNPTGSKGDVNDYSWINKAQKYLSNASPSPETSELIAKIWNEYAGLDYATNYNDEQLLNWHKSDFSQEELNKSIDWSNTDKTIEEEDEIPYDWQDFDAFDFKNSAKDAAAADIADEFGEEIPELGSEEDAEEFVSDLERANLRLPSDEEELEKIQQMMDKKKAEKQSMGSFSLNEGDVPVLADSMISLEDDEQANLQDMLQQKLAEKQSKPKNSIYTGEEMLSEGEKNKMLKLMGVIKEEYPGQFVFDSKKDDQK